MDILSFEIHTVRQPKIIGIPQLNKKYENIKFIFKEKPQEIFDATIVLI